MPIKFNDLKTVNRIIGRNTHEQRAMQGLSINIAAQQLCITPELLDCYELGKETISIERIVTLARILEINAFTLLEPPLDV